jgi:putative addiction module component (TIGR02574 family)
MKRHAAEVLRHALALSAEARAALIDALIESLDPAADEGVERAWKEEIDRRLAEKRLLEGIKAKVRRTVQKPW